MKIAWPQALGIIIIIIISAFRRRLINRNAARRSYHCRVPDTEWSFQDGGLYIVKKVGVKILTIVVLYSLS